VLAAAGYSAIMAEGVFTAGHIVRLPNSGPEIVHVQVTAGLILSLRPGNHPVQRAARAAPFKEPAVHDFSDEPLLPT